MAFCDSLQRRIGWGISRCVLSFGAPIGFIPNHASESAFIAWAANMAYFAIVEISVDIAYQLLESRRIQKSHVVRTPIYQNFPFTYSEVVILANLCPRFKPNDHAAVHVAV